MAVDNLVHTGNLGVNVAALPGILKFMRSVSLAKNVTYTQCPFLNTFYASLSVLILLALMICQ